MAAKQVTALALIGLCASLAFAAELVGVEGSGTQYPTPIELTAAGKTFKLRLTGTAMRRKLVFNVYTIGSYVQDDVKVHSADELAVVSCYKRMHLVMERDVDGKDMADAFKTAIRLNYPAPAFEAELGKLMDYMRSHPVKKGDHIWLTHLPGKGLHCIVVGKTEITIENPAFARAVWDIYLGRNNLGENIKRDLASRL